jgi:hypothetical protein
MPARFASKTSLHTFGSFFLSLCPVSMHSVGPKSSNCKILDLQKETSEAGCVFPYMQWLI